MTGNACAIFSPAQLQMLLGTLLGDGCLACQSKQSGIYYSRHGGKQHEYNCQKFTILSEFTNTEPKLTKNLGYGKISSRWQSKSLPEFKVFKNLCYSGYRDGRSIKKVTRKWLSLMTIEAVAWWYMDDGSLAPETGYTTFHTEGFTEPEVRLLSLWLKKTFGIHNKIRTVKSRSKPGTYYWIIHLNYPATRKLFDLIQPYVLPCMRYKVMLSPRRETAVCVFCGKTFQLGRNQAKLQTTVLMKKSSDCCSNPECQQARHRRSCHKHMAKPGVRENKNNQLRNYYWTNHEYCKELSKIAARQWRNRHPDRVIQGKQRYRKKLQAARAARPWTCQRCGLSEPQGTRDTKTKYCKACRKIVTETIKQKYQTALVAERRKERSSRKLPCPGCQQPTSVGRNGHAMFCSPTCRHTHISNRRKVIYRLQHPISTESNMPACGT